MAMVTGSSPRPNPWRARPATTTTNWSDTAASTQPASTTASATEDHVPLPGAVGQPAHDRRGQRTGEQGRGEQPLGGAQADVVGLGDGRDERRPEAADDGHQRGHQHQGRHQRPGDGADGTCAPVVASTVHRPHHCGPPTGPRSRSGTCHRLMSSLADIVAEAAVRRVNPRTHSAPGAAPRQA